ncbi:MAG: glycosyltransferase [Myxococcaceae bacterium]
MKILIPGPAFEDSFSENVAIALRDMGHSVAQLPETHSGYYALPRLLWRAAQERLWGYRPTARDRAVLRLARTFKPDVVLGLTWDIHPEVLAELGQACRGRRVLWWADPPANSQRWGVANPEWDVIYAKDPELVRKARLLGKRSGLLHEAMNPKWHRPVADAANSTVAVVGNYYAFRQALCLRLHRDGVALGVYGSKLPGWAHPEIRRLHTGRYVVREEKSRIFGEALACLNTTSFAEGNSLNCRAFEIAGAGGLQLLEHRDIVSECFEPGRELLTFRTYEELLESIQRAMRHPEEMKTIRAAAAKRALAQHTYAHRLERILGELA